MKKRKLLFYNDSRHFYMYCYDPPIRLEEAWAPIDEIAGTQVDTFVYCYGAGQTMFHNTKVGEIWGERFKEFDALYAYQCAENIKSLIDRGLDPLNVLIERAHERGLEFFSSLRLMSSGDPKDPSSVFISQFKVDHPEWCQHRSGRTHFDFAHPEVRAERFALIEETVNNYDVDGFELDWAFEPYYFEDDEVEQNAPILTEYMRKIRRMVEGAAQARGRPIVLGARVLPTLDGNRGMGMDVPAWLQEGLLDFVVPNFYGYHHLDADFPFKWLVELARPTGCQVYPALQSRILGPDPALEHRVSPLMEYPAKHYHYYAGAAAYWARGADGIYLPWFVYPHGTNHQLLSEIHDPDLLREKTKHYAVRSSQEDAASLGYTAPLPLKLKTGLEAPGQIVPFFIADDLERANALLKLRLGAPSPKDFMTVSLNGQPLPAPTRVQPVRYGYTWLDYHLPPGLLKQGRNELGVAIHSRPPRLAAQVTVEGVEVVVTHARPMPDVPDM